MKVKTIKKALKSKAKNDLVVPSKDLLSTGSTLLNKGITGRIRGGIAKTDYVLVVGDSQAGKTWIALNTLAEAANNPEFDDYKLIYDGPENGAKMNLARFFGKKAASRIMPPKGTWKDPQWSETVQEMYYNFDDAMNEGPCIYVEDSMDGLDDDDDIEQFEEDKKAYKKGKPAGGTYGIQKAKTNARNIRRMIRKMRKTGSILIIIAQAKDKIGGHIPGQKSRAGGKALKFFAHTEIWLSIKQDIMKDVGLGAKKSRQQQGILAKIKIEKSRHTGRERSVEVPIYHSYGIDDVGSCVDYLVNNGHWKKKDGGIISAKEFDFKGRREEVIHHIEQEGCEKELQSIVSTVWDELEAQLAIHRKQRYA